MSLAPNEGKASSGNGCNGQQQLLSGVARSQIEREQDDDEDHDKEQELKVMPIELGEGQLESAANEHHQVTPKLVRNDGGSALLSTSLEAVLRRVAARAGTWQIPAARRPCPALEAWGECPLAIGVAHRRTCRVAYPEPPRT